MLQPLLTNVDTLVEHLSRMPEAIEELSISIINPNLSEECETHGL